MSMPTNKILAAVYLWMMRRFKPKSDGTMLFREHKFKNLDALALSYRFHWQEYRCTGSILNTEPEPLVVQL